MKSAVLFFLSVLMSASIWAQKGISFQGIARDPQGNAIANQTISVQFTIGNFSETQNLNTDNFGVFSATIGAENTTDFENLVFANMDENLTVEVDGTTIYNDKFNSVPYAKAAENGVPVGAIMPFAGPKNKIPDGWLYCDGTSYATTGMYGALYNVIGTAWGDDGGNFRVPDLRGYFLRGVDDGEGVDPDASSRTAKNTNGNTGDAVGSYQTDNFGIHNHTGSATSSGSHNHSILYDKGGGGDYGSGDMATVDDFGNFGANHRDYTETGGDHTHALSIDNNGGNETRPENASVIFIIKY